MKSYVWGLNKRYYIDFGLRIAPLQMGTVPKFVADELIRLASIEKMIDGERSLSDIEIDLDKI